MSKKKFTDGLESLLSPGSNEDSGKGTSFLRNPFAPAGKQGEPAVARKASSLRKTFTTDLDSLLEEALHDAFPEPKSANAEAGSYADSKAQSFHQQVHRRRPMSGLDYLIRRTVEAGAAVEIDEKGRTRRLTVTFDREKLDKLKEIARTEKAYIKDILGEIVAEYIKKYDSQRLNG